MISLKIIGPQRIELLSVCKLNFSSGNVQCAMRYKSVKFVVQKNGNIFFNCREWLKLRVVSHKTQNDIENWHRKLKVHIWWVTSLDIFSWELHFRIVSSP